MWPNTEFNKEIDLLCWSLLFCGNCVSCLSLSQVLSAYKNLSWLLTKRVNHKDCGLSSHDCCSDFVILALHIKKNQYLRMCEICQMSFTSLPNRNSWITSSWSFLQINNVEQFYKAKQRTTHANHLCCVMRVTRLMPGTIATTKVKTQRNMHTNQST
jgi:hypothetical protein